MNNKSNKRDNLNFLEMNIAIDSILHCEKTGEDAKVVASKKVLFRGEEVFLTIATENVLGKNKRSLPHFRIWTYNGRNFMDIYDEVYGKKI